MLLVASSQHTDVVGGFKPAYMWSNWHPSLVPQLPSLTVLSTVHQDELLNSTTAVTAKKEKGLVNLLTVQATGECVAE
jgi:hypothetical protein